MHHWNFISVDYLLSIYIIYLAAKLTRSNALDSTTDIGTLSAVSNLVSNRVHVRCIPSKTIIMAHQPVP